MKYIISYSLYGNKPKYLIGAIRNAEQISVFYPGWQARFYVGSSVPIDIRKRLLELGAEVIPVMGREDPSAMFWRFQAFSDFKVDLVLVRDADSRFSNREKAAVNEWLRSDKDIHIMRDHPAHNCAILGGLWGCRAGILRHLWAKIEKMNIQGRYGEDQEFLEKYVYAVTYRSSIIHDSFFARESWVKPFPVKREGLAFVGEIFDENDVPCQVDRNVIAKTINNKYYCMYLWWGRFLHRFLRVWSVN